MKDNLTDLRKSLNGHIEEAHLEKLEKFMDINVFATQDEMIKERDTEKLFGMMYKLLDMAADLYADGDKARVRIKSNPDSGDLEVFLDGKLLDRFDDAKQAIGDDAK